MADAAGVPAPAAQLIERCRCGDVAGQLTTLSDGLQCDVLAGQFLGGSAVGQITATVDATGWSGAYAAFGAGMDQSALALGTSGAACGAPAAVFSATNRHGIHETAVHTACWKTTKIGRGIGDQESGEACSLSEPSASDVED